MNRHTKKSETDKAFLRLNAAWDSFMYQVGKSLIPLLDALVNLLDWANRKLGE